MHHPVTQAVHRYLRDYREALRAIHLAAWEANALESNVDPENRGRVLTLAEVADLQFGHMLTFYALPEGEEEEGNARKTA